MSADAHARGGPQVIPRPRHAAPGAPAPWAGRAPQRVTLDQVRRAFAARSHPPVSPSDTAVVEGARPAAVLCPMFDEDDQAWIILTRRSSSLRLHTGEVSFPGGRLDVGEEPVAAALREANEEVGIDPAAVEIIGRLSTVSTVRNPSPISPFVGIIEGGRPHLQANPAEVERVITVPLAELFAEEVYREESWDLGDHGVRPFYFFELIGDTVWGATGRIVRELIDVVWDLPDSVS